MKRSRTKRVLSIVGARPQFIKLARLAPALNRICDHHILHTGQHYDASMSSVFFKQLRIPPADLNLKIGGGTHGKMTGRMLAAIEKQFLESRPDFVIVYGDTNSTLAGALAAAKLDIPVGHVEAGLRSGVTSMPEEINRKLTDQLSRLLFCPTNISIRNLRREGIRSGLIKSGDLMYELLHDSAKAIAANSQFLRKHGLRSKQYLYLTVHRAATVDSQEHLIKLVDMLGLIDNTVLFPVHPRTRKLLRRFGLYKRLASISSVKMLEPLGYLDSLTAAANAKFILTDSGGLQKEALFLGRPVLTLREETEWVETLRRGNRLVGLDINKIVRALSRPAVVRKPVWRVDNIRPSKRIAASIGDYLRRV